MKFVCELPDVAWRKVAELPDDYLVKHTQNTDNEVWAVDLRPLLPEHDGAHLELEIHVRASAFGISMTGPTTSWWWTLEFRVDGLIPLGSTSFPIFFSSTVRVEPPERHFLQWDSQGEVEGDSWTAFQTAWKAFKQFAAWLADERRHQIVLGAFV